MSTKYPNSRRLREELSLVAPGENHRRYLLNLLADVITEAFEAGQKSVCGEYEEGGDMSPEDDLTKDFNVLMWASDVDANRYPYGSSHEGEYHEDDRETAAEIARAMRVYCAFKQWECGGCEHPDELGDDLRAAAESEET